MFGLKELLVILSYGNKRGGVKLRLNNSILETIRESVGLGSDVNSFDIELLLHINAAISKINQNGAGKLLLVSDETPTWEDLKDETQTKGNESFQLIPLFVALSTKLIFDPPPPSMVDYYSRSTDELLWRLKVAYEQGGE